MFLRDNIKIMDLNDYVLELYKYGTMAKSANA